MPGQEDLVRIIDSTLEKNEIRDVIAALGPLKTEIQQFAGISIFTKDTNGATQFRAQTQQITEGLARIKTLETELDNLRKTHSSANKQRTDQEIADSQKKAEATRARVRDIRSEEDAYKNLTNQYSKALAESRKLSAEYGIHSTQARGAAREANELSEKIQKINKAAGESRGGVGRYTEGIKDFAKELLSAGAAFFGIQQGVEFIRESIKDFMAAEASTARLKNILSNMGREDVFEELAKEAHHLSEELGVVTEKDVTETFQKLVTYGKLSKNQILELTPVIADFAAKQRIDMPEATAILTKALEGNVRGLREYGINVKEGKDATERYKIIMEQLAPKVKGASQAQGDLTVEMKKSQVATEELRVKIGEEFAPAISAVWRAILEGVHGIPQVVSSVGGMFRDVVTGAKEAWYQIKALFGNDKDLTDFHNAERMKDKIAYESKKMQDAREYAEGFRREAAKKTVSDQEKEIRNQTILMKADLERYRIAKERGQLNTLEGQRLKDEAFKSVTLVQVLRAQLASSKDNKPFFKSTGGGGKKAKEEDYFEGKKKMLGSDYFASELYDSSPSDEGHQGFVDNIGGQISGTARQFAEQQKVNDLKAKDVAEKKKLSRELEVTIAKETVNTIEKLENAKFERQMNQIQTLIDKNNKLHETETKNIQNSSLSQQEKAAAQINLDAKVAAENEALHRKQRDIKVKEAAFDKAVAIERATLNTALAVTNAISTGDPYTAALRAAIVGAIGAAEIAAAIATPIPTYAKGTENHPGGPMIVGEKGPEIILNPDGSAMMTPGVPTLTYGKRGTKVITADEVNQMLYSDMIRSTAYEINNRKELQEIKEAIQEGTLAQIRAMSKKQPIHIHNHFNPGFTDHINRSVKN